MSTTDPEHTHHTRAILLLLLAATLWSIAGLFIKKIDWAAPAISGARSLIAAFTIVIWYRGRLRFTWSRWQIAAALAYAGTVILFVLANKLTTAANAVLLQYAAPIYVGLAAPWFLGEHNRPSDWIAIIVTLAGMALFFFDQLTPAGLLGNIAAIVSGVFFAALALFMRKQKGGSAVESIVLGNLIAAAVGVPFMHGPFPDAIGWAALVVLGVVQLGLSYIAYSAALRYATAMEASVVPMLEPILNPIWVLLLLGERPGPWAIVGGFIVLGAVAFRTVIAVRARAGAPAQPAAAAS